MARRAGYYLAERVRAMSGEGTGAGVGEKRPRSEVSVDIGDGHGPCVYRFVVCKTSTARAGKKVNKKIKVKEIVSNGPARTVDHTVGLLAGESLDSEDDRRSAIARFYKKRARAELAPAAEGTPHAKRERNSPDQFSPVPESEQDHWVWTRDHGHEDRGFALGTGWFPRRLNNGTRTNLPPRTKRSKSFACKSAGPCSWIVQWR